MHGFSFMSVIPKLAFVRVAFARVATISIALGMLALSQVALAQGYTYRYVNDEGVKVMGNSIPPHYVSRGYEVLSATGRLLRVVEPAPDPEFLAAAKAKAELKEKYDHLAMRYSSEHDIEAAKQRKLVHVDASILLADSSIDRVQEQIDKTTLRAASYERAGKAVPKRVVDALALLDEKMSANKMIKASRVAEKQAIVDRFEADKALFLKGAATFEEKAPHEGSSAQESDQEPLSAEQVTSSLEDEPLEHAAKAVTE